MNLLRLLAVMAALLLTMAACSSEEDTQTADAGGDTEDIVAPTEEDTTATDATEEPANATDNAQETGAAETSADGPIRVGLLTSLTGRFTPWGLQTRAGMQLGIDEINDSGGVEG
jgi:hypothetical protein